MERQAFNKENPVELLSQLLKILKRQGLDDAATAVKKVTPIVNDAWSTREGSMKISDRIKTRRDVESDRT